MKLIYLNIAKLGPFYHKQQIDIDPRVTILTGSNDVGKSSVLRLLSRFLANEKADEMDVNQDHLQEAQRTWTDDPAPQMELGFELKFSTEAENWAQHLTPGDKARVCRSMAHRGKNYEFSAETQSHGTHENWRIRLPKTIFLPTHHALREQINLKAPNPLEDALLHVGFGAPFKYDRLSALSAINYSRQLKEAEDRINKEMERCIPNPASLRFSLIPLEGKRDTISVLLRDRHDAMTPFGLRGAGLRKMITLMAELLTSQNSEQHRILLLDEPETSLHPDAQHLLREYLFDLTEDNTTQVIYATHSPCMINPLRSEQIRLLRRAVVNGKPTSSTVRHAADTNFLPLRTSLGISPADSLLFAPVTVIIEGDTEFKCLSPLIIKLASPSEAESKEVKKLLSLSHFLDGMGDNFEYLCRLAKSQGTRVILFLDGDKQKVLQQHKVRETHADVTIVLLPHGEEFEQLVPTEIYFEALAEELNQKGIGKDLYKQCQAWTALDEKRSRRAFSKQVWGWLEDTFQDPLPTKPAVMRRAIEMATVEQINAAPLKTLLEAIKDKLVNTSF